MAAIASKATSFLAEQTRALCENRFPLFAQCGNPKGQSCEHEPHHGTRQLCGLRTRCAFRKAPELRRCLRRATSENETRSSRSAHAAASRNDRPHGPYPRASRRSVSPEKTLRRRKIAPVDFASASRSGSAGNREPDWAQSRAEGRSVSIPEMDTDLHIKSAHMGGSPLLFPTCRVLWLNLTRNAPGPLRHTSTSGKSP